MRERPRRRAQRVMNSARNAKEENGGMMEPDQPMQTGKAGMVAKRIEKARRELLDLTFRNPLLSYKPRKARGVVASEESAAAVFDALVKKRAKARFLPKTSAAPEKPADGAANKGDWEIVRHGVRRTEKTGALVEKPVDPAPAPTTRARGRKPFPIQTGETERDLEARLLRTSTLARTSMEEQGVNTLFIALGMVEWYEAAVSDAVRKAPLILVPVTLERGDVRAEFLAEYDGGEVGVNLSFIEKVKTDFGLDIPDIPEDEDDEETDVPAYFAKVKAALGSMTRWKVDESAVVLGFFSFQKLLMYHDLDPRSWGESGVGMAGERVINAMFGGGDGAGGGFSDPGPAIAAGEKLDDKLSPQDLRHVLDADSSQASVIADVAKGRDLVVQGPPGTGKSQTIVNLIADSIGAGKTVLFVSEKMAALEVVKRRLDDIGLGSACMDLHSHKASKREFLDELKRTVDLHRPVMDGVDENIESLERTRDDLNRYADAANSPVGDTGVSPNDAMGFLARVERENGDALRDAPPVVIDGIGFWSQSEFRGKREAASNLRLRLDRTGAIEKHPFRNSRLSTPLSPMRRGELGRFMRLASQNLDGLLGARALLRKTAGHVDEESLNDPSAVSAARRETDELIDNAVRRGVVRAKYESVLTGESWNVDEKSLRRMRVALLTGGEGPLGFFSRLFSSEFKSARQSVKALWRANPPGDKNEWLSVLDDLALVRSLSARMTELTGSGFSRANVDELDALGEIAVKASDALAAYTASAEAVEGALEMDLEARFGSNGGILSLPFSEQRSVLDEWERELPTLDDVINLNIGLKRAADEGLGKLADAAKSWSGAPDALLALFDRARNEAIVERAYRERPEIAGFDSAIHEDKVNRFAGQDLRSFEVNRVRVARAHYDGLPDGLAGGEVSVLRREFEKRRRHFPIRKLMRMAGGAVQAIKPVFMMSPLSIANYVPPRTLEFDLAIFDEASQVKPVDALGALMRARQVVVVGDSQQLPPTSFFDRIGGEEEDSGDEEFTSSDVESVLGLCRAQGLPVETLRWHYRSRHESLIALSNREFYNGDLVVFASPDFNRSETGLRFRHMPDAVYENRRNREEAKAVARAAMEHAGNTPDLTLGIAAFSMAQSEAIQDELESLRRQDSSKESFFGAHPHEPFFVKNLENVQGDERDVIFISVGYGRNRAGVVSMNFGPLNNEGGHRRLNVLITRARRCCEVFANLRAHDIALDRTQSQGVRAFKAFLQYAETGELPADAPSESGQDFGSPFQKILADSIRERGWEVHEEVASGGRYIDIAVLDPNRRGRYALGVEFDGASYHGSRWARDRDRLRDQVLEGLGWRIHRVWSTDYFANPKREVDKVEQSILQAVADGIAAEVGGEEESPPVVQPAEAAERPPEIRREESSVPDSAKKRSVAPYETASLSVSLGGRSLYETPRGSLAEAAARVIDVESPVHADEAARRLADALGIRLSGKARRALGVEIAETVRRGRAEKRGDFLWSVNAESALVVRDRSKLPAQRRKIELIAPEEIAESIRIEVESAYSMRVDEAVSKAAATLGFGRASANIGAAMRDVLRGMEREGVLARDGDELRIAR